MSFSLGQLFFVGLSGPALTLDEKKFLIENDVGGVILFGRNIVSPEQLHALCSELHSLRQHTKSRQPLFISIDMEGGRVARLKAPFTQWPPLRKLGVIDSPTLSYHFALAMGQELRAFGINLDFAPCADIFSNPKNTVIGDRSIGDDPELVAKHVSALIRGYLKSEIIPCAKHFPGHGNTLIDSHEDLPTEEVSLERLQQHELKPFIKAFRSRVPMVMSAHIVYSQIDPEWPATLSEVFLKKMLRDELRYRGLIVTDDLGMKALSKHHTTEAIAVRALFAGADMLLYCNEPDAPPRALAAVKKALADRHLSVKQLEQSFNRVLEVKNEFLRHPDPLLFSEALLAIENPAHKNLSLAIREEKIPPHLSAIKET